MTEKRFTLNENEDWWSINDNANETKRLWGKDIVELLNRLNDENKELKKTYQDLQENYSVCANKTIRQGEHLTRLTKKNERLRKELNSFKPVLFESKDGAVTLYEKKELENE